VTNVSDRGRSTKRRETTIPARAGHTPYLLVASFVTGTAILVLELLGTRVIGPYYGASVYVWSSLIGVTLAALALGYWAGGYTADRWPHLTSFAVEVTAAALFVSTIPWMHKAVLSATTPLGLKAGALVSAAVLFGPPLVLLSMAGPVAIRLVTSQFTLLGWGVGRIYGVSTLGSMLGAVVTGFVLIPTFPVRAILFGVALSLLGLGAIGLLLARRVGIALASTTVGIGLALLLAGSPAPPSNLVYMTNSFYGELKVLDVQERRVLFINGLDNGFVNRRTFESSTPYTSYVGYLRLARPRANRALCIGLGVGSIPRSLRVDYGIDTDVVEIDPQVVAIARRYFDFPGDIPVFVEDGRMFVERARASYDLVFLDAFSSDVHPFHLFTREFFASVDRVLEPGGILAINLVAFPYGEHSQAWMSAYRTIAERFRFVRVFKGQDVSPEETDRWANLLLVASHEPLPDPAALAVPGKDHADVLATMAARELAPESSGGADRSVVLTDDYNPMDDQQRELFVAWRRHVIENTKPVLLFDGTR
jgi:spermidine synthase